MAKIIKWDHNLSESCLPDIEGDLEIIKNLVDSGKVEDVVFLVMTTDGTAHFKWAGGPHLMNLLAATQKAKIERQMALLEYMQQRLVGNLEDEDTC